VQDRVMPPRHEGFRNTHVEFACTGRKALIRKVMVAIRDSGMQKNSTLVRVGYISTLASV